jgi:hypothetical protein
MDHRENKKQKLRGHTYTHHKVVLIVFLGGGGRQGHIKHGHPQTDSQIARPYVKPANKY